LKSLRETTDEVGDVWQAPGNWIGFSLLLPGKSYNLKKRRMKFPETPLDKIADKRLQSQPSSERPTEHYDLPYPR
jgi:hypothetical protein